MKITVEAATGTIINGGINFVMDVYLNEEIKGWLSIFGKMEIEDVPEGENTITITVCETRKKEIRLISTQDVHIWVRENQELNLFKKNYIDTLVLGKDVKVIEEKEEKMR
ncbi:MAG: hypothetical protein KHZ62_08480 [Clostridiales bacterium]|nr:hypothetical protein [Clostridiales bacterium]